MDDTIELWELCEHGDAHAHGRCSCYQTHPKTGEKGMYRIDDEYGPVYWVPCAHLNCPGGRKVILEYVGLIVEHDGVRYRVAHIREED